MQVNEEKRKKFMEYAGKRVNNVLHDIQILEPMSRSSSYDFTRQDVDEMFNAMQETLNNARTEFEKKFEEKSRNEKKVFSFGNSTAVSAVDSISNTSVVSNCVASTVENLSENSVINSNESSIANSNESSSTEPETIENAVDTDTF